MMESIKSTWTQLMEIPEARWIVWGTALVVMMLVGFYVAKKFRDMALGSGSGSTEFLPDIDKMRLEGKLDDSEYQQVKSSLAKERNRVVNEETDKNN